MDLHPRFHAIMEEAGMAPPPYDVWRALAGDNSDLWPIPWQGEMIGGLLIVGQTLHMAVLPAWHGCWATRTMWRAWMAWRKECPVDLFCSPPVDNTAARALAERLGFEFQSVENGHAIYKLGAAKCPLH